MPHKNELPMYRMAGIIFTFLFIVAYLDQDEPNAEHIQYCERVAAYEETKHLQQGDILGHRNYEDRNCEYILQVQR